MFKPIGKFLDNVLRNIGSFRIETNSVKAFCDQRQNIFFASCYEKRIAFGGQLFQTETVIVRYISAVQKTDFGKRTIDFYVPFPLIAEYRFGLC